MTRTLALFGVALATLALVGASGCAGPSITLIATFNLTGPDSVLDLACYRGAEVAVEELNASGGALGRPLRLVAVDTASDDSKAPELAAAALRADPGSVAGLGYCYSSYVLEVGPAFRTAGIPFVTPGATDATLPERLGPDFFLACYSDAAQATAMAQYAYDQLRLRRVALWANDRRDYTRTVAEHFERSFTALGGTVQRWSYPSNAPDYGALIEAFRRASPPFDAIYSASTPGEGEAQVGQIRAAGVEAALLSGDGWDDPRIFALSRQRSIAAIYFTTHHFVSVDTPAMRSFVAAYRDRFGAPPENAFAPLGYDTVNLIADAIRRAGSTDPTAVSRALRATTNFPGIVGPITYAHGRRVPDKPVEVIGLDRGVRTSMWVVTPRVD